MTEIINSKAIASELLQKVIAEANSDMQQLAALVCKDILSQKMRYPMLEYCTVELYSHIPSEKQLVFLDEVVKPKQNGAWVIVGKMLQLRLQKHTIDECVNEANKHILFGNEWVVCDTIAERVIGQGMLLSPAGMLPVLKRLVKDDNPWLVRAVGVATHYATKKKIGAEWAEELFKLLLLQSATTDFHTKKGIGWGAKTVAKFHPQIVEKYKAEIFDNPNVKRWFITKVNMGLNWRRYKQLEI